MRKIFIHILILCYCFSYAQDNEQLFNNANALYTNAKYEDAIAKYESILNTDKHSAELYFNLANAHYKLNHIAPTIYYYEKALLLNPDDADVKTNLSYAQNMTIDAIQSSPKVGFSRIIENIVNMAEADTWAIIAVTSIIIFVILFLIYHFAYTTVKKRIAFILSLLCLFVVLFSVVMAFQKTQIDKNDNPAIVFTQESRVKGEPKKNSEELFRLHEGTKVQVLESYEGWYKIEIQDNTFGWIPSDDIKLLKSF